MKPEMLQCGDKIAIVSLSWSDLGDENLIHKYYIAKERLENDFWLEVVVMPNAEILCQKKYWCKDTLIDYISF